MTDGPAAGTAAVPAGTRSGFDADVAVVGLGAWGSATLWRLAERGASVIGIERHPIAHPFGSSHGTRMFRLTCLEHPGLVPLAVRSAQLWAELSALSGVELLTGGGGLLIGPRDGPIVAGTLAVAARHELAVRVLGRDELTAAHPAHAGLGPDEVAVREETAGLLVADAAIRAAVGRAEQLGALVLAGTAVRSLTPDRDGVTVAAGWGALRVRRVVVTVGAWLPQLVATGSLRVARSPSTWFTAPDPAAFTLDRFPVFLRELPEGAALFGHGVSPGSGAEVKLGREDRAGAPASPDADALDRSVGAADWAALCAALPALVPGLAPGGVAVPARAQPCLFARTPDGQFLLGPAPGQDRVLIGGGCGNHGGKHAAGIGEVLADLATGADPSIDVTFADPARFG